MLYDPAEFKWFDTPLLSSEHTLAHIQKDLIESVPLSIG